MRDQTVAIKGTKDGLLISLSAEEEWLQLTSQLAAHLDEKGDFFSGARITVDVGARPVTKHELGSLKALLERRSMTLWLVLSESATTHDAASALDIRSTLSSTLSDPDASEMPLISSEEDGTIGVMIRRTLRSGRTVHSEGHVVIYGDVNPGAEIIAVGDVVVWGRLRGNVHAGADGDEAAVICALDMMPNQLRIAGYIVTSPPEKRDPKPEVALIRDQQIVVEAWRRVGT